MVYKVAFRFDYSRDLHYIEFPLLKCNAIKYRIMLKVYNILYMLQFDNIVFLYSTFSI